MYYTIISKTVPAAPALSFSCFQTNYTLPPNTFRNDENHLQATLLRELKQHTRPGIRQESLTSADPFQLAASQTPDVWISSIRGERTGLCNQSCILLSIGKIRAVALTSFALLSKEDFGK